MIKDMSKLEKVEFPRKFKASPVVLIAVPLYHDVIKKK